jgi:hypothetical protein
MGLQHSIWQLPSQSPKQSAAQPDTEIFKRCTRSVPSTWKSVQVYFKCFCTAEHSRRADSTSSLRGKAKPESDLLYNWRSVSQPASQPVGRSAGLSVSQSVRQTASRSVGQSVSQSVGQSASRLVSQSYISQKHAEFQKGKLKSRDNLEDLGLNGRIIINSILKK